MKDILYEKNKFNVSQHLKTLNKRQDYAQREEINEIKKSLGSDKDLILAKYFHDDLAYLSRTDQIYLAGMAQIIEERIKRKQMGIGGRIMPHMMYRQTQRSINSMLKKCSQKGAK